MTESCKIVVTDDDEDDFLLLKEAFEQLALKHELIHLDNGEELLNYLSALNQQNDRTFPNLILLDINMPKIDGIQSLEKIKMSQSYSSVPVIMYSTSNSPVQKEQCTVLGAVDFVTKGSTFEETIAFVKSLDLFLTNDSAKRI